MPKKHHSTKPAANQAPASPLAAYQQLLAQGKLKADAAQRHAVDALQALHEALAESGSKTLLKRLAGKDAPPGLYLWGPVGRGKSMLMDLFFQNAPVAKKRRTHFHAFMLDMHARIHRWRNSKVKKGDNPIPPLAVALAKEATLLCLDELQVTDVADAMILGRLFNALLDEGVTIVFTSNRPPKELYQGGLQRETFLQFVDLIVQRMPVVELSGPEDYRMKQLQAMQKVYFSPLGHAAVTKMNEAFTTMAPAPEPRTFEIQGRRLELRLTDGGIARASFHDLCEKPLGAADYLAIAQHFHTLFLDGIPLLSPEKRNEARRFVTLIDTLYDHKVKLICSAEAAPDTLYPSGDGSFEFARTVSRLVEMQSAGYLASAHIS